MRMMGTSCAFFSNTVYKFFLFCFLASQEDTEIGDGGEDRSDRSDRERKRDGQRVRERYGKVGLFLLFLLLLNYLFKISK